MSSFLSVLRTVRSYASVHLKPSTAEGYRQVREGHLYSAIGDRPLHAVTRAEVKRLIGQLLAKGLKKRTIHNKAPTLNTSNSSLVMVVSALRWTSIRICSKETIGTMCTGLMTHKRTWPV